MPSRSFKRMHAPCRGLSYIGLQRASPWWRRADQVLDTSVGNQRGALDQMGKSVRAAPHCNTVLSDAPPPPPVENAAAWG